MQAIPADPDVLTVRQAAELLAMSTETIYRLARQGLLPGAVHVGRSWRVSRRTLLAYIHETRVQSS